MAADDKWRMHTWPAPTVTPAASKKATGQPSPHAPSAATASGDKTHVTTTTEGAANTSPAQGGERQGAATVSWIVNPADDIIPATTAVALTARESPVNVEEAQASPAQCLKFHRALLVWFGAVEGARLVESACGQKGAGRFASRAAISPTPFHRAVGQCLAAGSVAAVGRRRSLVGGGVAAAGWLMLHMQRPD